VSSQRVNLEEMIGQMHSYSRSLRPEEREIMRELLRAPMKHVGAISSANSLHAWSFLLLSVMLEQEKRLRRLERESLANRRVSKQELGSVMVER
jgi:hypothetical protein